jgi:uncharacterized short protein YbdD (DUF466 family)
MPSRDGGRGTGDGALPLPTRIARVVRRIIGAPDYWAYLEHCRLAGHPPHLDERAYLSEFFASRGKGVRCC